MLRKLSTAALLILCSLTLQANQHPSQAAIASAHPAATVAGLETLAAGGNAFDAAVAVSAALAVVEPYGSGLGGGGFFLLRKAGSTPSYHFLDARERAPLAATADLYLRNGQVEPNLSLNGALAAAIPGLPAALVELAKRYGRLPLRDSLTPAIRLARDGVSIDRVYQQRAGWRLAALRDDPETARLFLADGEIPEEFSLLRQPELARLLERIARDGGVLVLLPFAAWEWQQASTPAWSLQATGLVLAAGLVPGLGAYWAYGFCQKVLGASRVAASLYLGPLYGGLTAWLVLDESLGWHHVMGACLILPGIYLASRKTPATT